MLATLQKYLVKGVPATIIPTWVDTDVIYPVPKSDNQWAKEHGLEGKFTIMYSGNFGATHEVDLLVEAARQLSARSYLQFVLIGSGENWYAFGVSLIMAHDSNITILPWQPSEYLPESLSSADVSFVSLRKGIEGVSMPSKTYYAMAAGSAIIASCVVQSDLANVVRSSACGVVVRPNVVEDIVNACEHLSSHPLELETYKKNARSSAVGSYSRKVNSRLVRETLEQLTEERLPWRNNKCIQNTYIGTDVRSTKCNEGASGADK
jgi:glycosyltransferase involved in cell wall biosynthesis